MASPQRRRETAASLPGRIDRSVRVAHVRKITSRGDSVCVWCGESPAEGERTVEHLVPLSAGGRRSSENEVFACRYCNSRRGDAPAGEWAARYHRLGIRVQLERLARSLEAYARFWAQAGETDDVLEARRELEYVEALRMSPIGDRRAGAKALVEEALAARGSALRRLDRREREAYRETLRTALDRWNDDHPSFGLARYAARCGRDGRRARTGRCLAGHRLLWVTSRLG